MPRNSQIVDADAHAISPATFWVDYLPAHLRDLAPRLEEGKDTDYVVFERRRKKVNLIAAQASRAGKDFKIEGRLSDSRKGGWVPAERLADTDEEGFDAAVLFGGGPLGTGNDELFMASFGAYNRRSPVSAATRRIGCQVSPICPCATLIRRSR